MAGRVTLIGAGELMPAMSGVHRAALARLKAPRPVFLDTPAGFETNADGIAAKAVAYYRRYLQTKLRVARFRHRQATPAEVAAAVAEVRAANLIFAGPGSPTYAVRHWRDTPVWAEVVRRFSAGAELLFASAASIAIGRYALPVYEIYKAGEDPFWAEGLDLLGCLGLRLAVVPHFDDRSGGDMFDTRFCYMGQERFDLLRARLPADVAVLGIDAYTAVCLDAEAQTASVSGKGGVTVVGVEGERRYPAGSSVPLAALSSAGGSALRSSQRLEATPAPARGPEPFQALAELIDAAALSESEKVELLAQLQTARGPAAEEAAAREAALADLVLELRQALREAKRFDLADRARAALTAMGYEVHDTPAGASWTRP